MRIENEYGEKTKSFKLRDIVLIQLQELYPVRDEKTATPNYKHEEFCESCLKFITKIYGEGAKFNKENLTKPSFKHFKKSVYFLWMDIKKKDGKLFSYITEERGNVMIKVDEETPEPVKKSAMILMKDRVTSQIKGTNSKITLSKKVLNYQNDVGLLPEPDE